MSKNLRNTFFLIILGISSVLGQMQDRERIFVDQQWMDRHMEDANLVILHVGTIEDYNTGHLKNALLITSQDFTRTVGHLRWELPEADRFREQLMKRGVSNNSTVVLYYGSGTFAPTFRLYFTMKYFGLGYNTFILDGGMPGWVAQNRKLESRPYKAEPSDFLYLYSNPELLIGKEELMRSTDQHSVQIVDARNKDYYSGETDGDSYYKRPGHLPGAVNITWTDMVDKNRFLKPYPVLLDYFSKAEISDEKEVVTYCHVGLRATVLHTIATLLGYEARLYDGSFNEWDGPDKDEYPVEKGN